MKSIRWKLILTSVLVVFVPIYLLNRYAIQFFDRFTRKALEEQMIHEAYIVGEQYKSMVLGARTNEVDTEEHEFTRLLQAYEPEVEAQLCVVSTNGLILFDSHTNSLVGADVSARREIRKALAGKYGARSSLTADRQYMFYYVALPVKQSNEVVAVAYVFRHTGPIVGAIKRMVANQQLAAAGALVLAVLIATMLAQTLTYRLRKLTRAAVAFAKGIAPWNEQVRGRDEIGELGRAMMTMASELENRNRYNRDFVSTVVHELKTPLTVVKGTIEILEDGAADQRTTRQKFLANMRYEVDRMIRMVWELAELTKLDIEMLRGQKEKVEYCQFVREVAERLAPTFDQAHAKFELIIPEKKITAVILPGCIEQVISNLLENAFRYTPLKGSVELQVEEGSDHTVITSVRDTGCGIAPANLSKIFDRFFTTEPKDKPGHVHSGLGLAIAKSIIERTSILDKPELGTKSCLILRVSVCAFKDHKCQCFIRTHQFEA